MFPVNDPADLKEAILQVQRDLRFQYVIGYRPPANLWDGRFRRVKLDVNAFIAKVRSALLKGNIKGAMQACEGEPPHSLILRSRKEPEVGCGVGMS